jgi:hypothetical protein
MTVTTGNTTELLQTQVRKVLTQPLEAGAITSDSSSRPSLFESIRIASPLRTFAPRGNADGLSCLQPRMAACLRE